MSWRQDKLKRVMISLIAGALTAGLPLALILVLALSEGRWSRPYADVLEEFAFWPLSTIEPLADALYPDRVYTDLDGNMTTDDTLVKAFAVVLLSLATSIAVYATAMYALLSRLAARAEA